MSTHGCRVITPSLQQFQPKNSYQVATLFIRAVLNELPRRESILSNERSNPDALAKDVGGQPAMNMFEEAVDAILTSDSTSKKAIAKRRVEVDKLRTVCYRLHAAGIRIENSYINGVSLLDHVVDY